MSDLNRAAFEIPAFCQRPETYLGADKAITEKDIYRFLWRNMQESRFEPSSVLDVGCATGDLLVFLRSKLPAARLAGLDLEPELIAAAKQRPDLAANASPASTSGRLAESR